MYIETWMLRQVVSTMEILVMRSIPWRPSTLDPSGGNCFKLAEDIPDFGSIIEGYAAQADRYSTTSNHWQAFDLGLKMNLVGWLTTVIMIVQCCYLNIYDDFLSFQLLCLFTYIYICIMNQASTTTKYSWYS